MKDVLMFCLTYAFPFVWGVHFGRACDRAARRNRHPAVVSACFLTFIACSSVIFHALRRATEIIL